MTNFFVVLDIETTRCGKFIIEIAYNIYNFEMELCKSVQFLLNEKENTKVDHFNKVTRYDIVTKGLNAYDAFINMKQDLSYCSYIVCHNISFDTRHIIKYYQKLCIDFTPPLYVCTMKLSSTFCNLKNKNGHKKSPKLSELYEKCFGSLPNENKCHSADFDIQITFDCFKYLLYNKIITQTNTGFISV